MDSVVIIPKSVLVLIEDIFYSLKSVVVCYILFFPGFWKRLAGCLLVYNY